jgi:hypothetical protein
MPQHCTRLRVRCLPASAQVIFVALRKDIGATREDRPTRSGPSSRVERRRLLAHHRRTEVQLRLVHIVRTTSKLQIVSGRLSSGRKWHDVMELEESALRASAVRADEGARPLSRVRTWRRTDAGTCRECTEDERPARGRLTAASFRFSPPLDDNANFERWFQRAWISQTGRSLTQCRRQRGTTPVSCVNWGCACEQAEARSAGPQ